MPQNEELFEERALKKLKSPEMLDQSVNFVSTPVKLSIIGLASLASFGFIWSIFGRVPEQVVGQSIFLDMVSTYEIQTTTPGIVIFNLPLFATEDELSSKDFPSLNLNHYFKDVQYFANTSKTYSLPTVESDQALDVALDSYSRLDDKRLNALFSTSMNLLQTATSGGFGARKSPSKLSARPLQSTSTVAFVINADALQKVVASFVTLQKTHHDYKTTLEQNNRLIGLAEMNKKYLKSSLDATKKAYDIGVVARLSIESSINDLAQADSSIVNSKGQIREAANNFVEAHAQFASALISFVRGGSVGSPSNDMVLEALSINNGDYVPAGTRIAVGERKLSSMQNPSTIRVFFENSDGQRVSPGQLAIVTPSIVQRAEYGGIIGHVITRPIPLLSSGELESMSTYEGFNKSMLDRFKAPVSVTVKLDRDPQGDYKWSGNLTPPYSIRNGTTASANITTQNKPPIQYLVPLFRTLTGGGKDN